jgi:PTH1 family peptidyl-tRNA hydrolase
MNRSGLSVREARDYHRIGNADLLIICDDFHLPLGKLRCRAKGSAGGQKGLQDIIRCLGSEEVARLRIGIGSPPEDDDVSDYVLSTFRADELAVIAQAVERAAEAAVDWVRDGIEVCMNRYNADATSHD